MNFLVISYLVYLLATVFITVYVGWFCYKNGWIHLKRIFKKEEALAQKLNQLLLTGYYLLNIGYALLSINTWEIVQSWQDVFSVVSLKTGIVVIFLGIMHYFNLWATQNYGHLLVSDSITN